MIESSLDEFLNYDPSKEMDIDVLRTAVRGHLADDEWVMIHPKAILHILDSMEAAEKDAARIDWLETITKINSVGSRTYGIETERNALFTIMPAWYQEKKTHSSLRESIDAAMASK